MGSHHPSGADRPRVFAVLPIAYTGLAPGPRVLRPLLIGG